MVTHRPPRRAFPALATLLLAAAAAAAAAPPKVHWRMECAPEEAPPRLVVTLTASGLDAGAKGVELDLQDWGEWTEVDAYHLTLVDAAPPVRVDPDRPTRLVVDVRGGFDGSLKVSYVIGMTRIGSNVYARHGLLPALDADERFVLAYSSNTLMQVVVDGAHVTAGRTLEVVPPRGWSAVTGWGGVSRGRRTCDVPDDATNTLIAFGVPTAAASRKAAGTSFDVVQLGAKEDVTARILDVVGALLPAYTANTGRSIDRPTRIVVTRAGYGGDRTDGAICIRHAEMTPRRVASPGITTFLAHELFHHWLGGALPAADPSLVWLKEGFTEYLACWHAASLGLIEPEELARKALGWGRTMAANGAWPTIDFTADGNAWRDGGQTEEVAYQGGALLALALDVELRAAGKPGLPAMIADLLAADGDVTQERLADWLAAQGLASFHAGVLAGGERPDAAALLARLAFEEAEVDAPLTYLGFRTDAEEPSCTVLEVDLASPAARAGVKVGDVLTGWWPTRGDRPEIGPSVETRFRFGLTTFDPEADEIHLGVRRGGEEFTVTIVPRPKRGGVRRGFSPTEETAPFLRFERAP